MNNYEIKRRIVESGESKVFENWHWHTGVSMEDFLKGLKWVCEDPGDNGRLTRELGCLNDGTLVKLYRTYNRCGDFDGFFQKVCIEGITYNMGWSGHVSINAWDRV